MREFCVDSRDMKTKLACYAWEPKADAKAVLIMAHGMAEHLMRYEEMAEYFVSQGIIFAGPDHLGHGKSAPAPDDLGYFCEQDPATVVVRDLHRVKKTIQAENPGLPVYLMGHSMGSYIARNYIERYGTGISGVILQGGNDTPRHMAAAGKLITEIMALFHGWRYRSDFCTKVTLGSCMKAFPEDPSGWVTKRIEVRERYKDDPLGGYTFTLNGFPAENALDHVVCINADAITETDNTLIPTGKLLPVEGTPYDFRTPVRLGDRQVAAPAGRGAFGGPGGPGAQAPAIPDGMVRSYDQNFCLNHTAADHVEVVASVYCPTSGRVMEVLNDKPGLQFFTGNRAAFAMESQLYPDTLNKPEFPGNAVLRPGETYHHTVIYRFSVK